MKTKNCRLCLSGYVPAIQEWGIDRADYEKIKAVVKRAE